MKIVKPNSDLTSIKLDSIKVFLAGGMKKPWRKEVSEKLSELDLDITVIDPTVEDWEKSIGEEKITNQKFLDQTDWEHDGLDSADINVFHFDDTSVSPITLFELGRFVNKDSIIYLEDGYEKEAYVEYIAHRFGVPIVKTADELTKMVSVRYHVRSHHDE